MSNAQEKRPCQGARHRKELGTQPFDPQWTLPSLVEKNPLVWMAEVNGLLVDLRDMPREVQEIAFEDSGGSQRPIVNEQVAREAI
jgi:hypothetical protein